MSRVMLCHGRPAEEQALLSEKNIEVLVCDDSGSMLNEVAVHHPDVVIYGLRRGSEADLAVLRLLRRIAPHLPLVVFGEEDQPAWTTPPDLRPLYYTPLPVEEKDLQGTIENALALGEH
jgi:DNA-binding NarL/FixJ family response regulator